MNVPKSILIILIACVFAITFIFARFLCNCRTFVSRSILPHLDKQAYRILDIGCGSCCLNKQLRRRREYHDVTSLDVVNAGKCDNPYIFNGKHIPFEDDTFDIGICAFVLHHTPHQKELLKELARTCAKIIIIEDTPVDDRDWMYAKKHARSDWGSCEKCFHRQKDWISLFTELDLCNHKLVNVQNVSRWSCPFARKPFLYPMSKSVFVLEK